MARRNGTDYYITGTGSIKVGFPNGEMKCMNCWGCITRQMNRDQKECFFTGRIIRYPDSEIAPFCPLEFLGEVEDEHT